MHKYKVISKLSSGAFGTVYNAQVLQGPMQGQQVAVKQIYMSDLVKRELAILQQLKPQQNLVQCYEIIEENEYQRSVIMQKGVYDLEQLIESMEYPISQDVAKCVAINLLHGLKHLHSQGFIHRDLKPSNIVIKKQLSKVAICDFGSAVRCTTGDQYSLEGFTRWYKPPEMLFGSRTYQYQVDIWSLGCILVELVTGEQLFPGKSELEQIALIANMIGDPSVKNWPSIVKLHDYGKINFVERVPQTQDQIAEGLGISRELAGFVGRMIRYEGRATAEELLQDQYLQGAGTVELPLGLFGVQRLTPKIIR